MDYFLPCDGFFILNQSRVASFKHKHGELTSAPKYTVGNDLLKAKPKRQPSLGSMPIVTVGKVWKFSTCFPGFTRIKLSNTADWYMWNITDLLPDESCVDLTYPDNMLAGSEGLNCHTDTMCSQTVRVFCIQSRRIDHKHGKILSDCQTRETLA